MKLFAIKNKQKKKKNLQVICVNYVMWILLTFSFILSAVPPWDMTIFERVSNTTPDVSGIKIGQLNSTVCLGLELYLQNIICKSKQPPDIFRDFLEWPANYICVTICPSMLIYNVNPLLENEDASISAYCTVEVEGCAI